MSKNHYHPIREQQLGLVAQIDRDPQALMLAQALALLAGPDGWAMMTRAELVATFGMNKTTAERKLSELEEKGLIEREEGSGGRLRLRGALAANQGGGRR